MRKIKLFGKQTKKLRKLTLGFIDNMKKVLEVIKLIKDILGF